MPCSKFYVHNQTTEWLQDVAVVSPHVRNILNKKIIQRFPTSFLMLDGMMLTAMIICFEMATIRYIKKMEDVPYYDLTGPLVILYITAGYFFLREFIQVVASLTLGAFGSWLYDTTNWLDVLVITLVTYFSVIMTTEKPVIINNSPDVIDPYQAFRTGAALTKGVLWTAVIYFLKSTRVDFAVFLNGVFYVCKRLIAFLLAVAVLLIAFAQMFWIYYLPLSVCTFECDEGDLECQASIDDCNFPHCTFNDSLLKVCYRVGTKIFYLFCDNVVSILIIFLSFILTGIHNDDGRDRYRNEI